MRTVGIIAEYNPFHNGHQWQIKKARELSGCDYVICVISGSFVQRGEPAVFDKWKRAEMAVRGGADLIIELPVVWAVRSAQYFATGGIRLLKALGIVSHVCFGAEHADLSVLWPVARAIDDSQTMNVFHSNLKAGQPYAAALSNAIQSSQHIPPTVLNQPNNILAIEYLRAISKFAPELLPLAIGRQSASHHAALISGSLSSAKAIRNVLAAGSVTAIKQAVPPATYRIVEDLLATQRGPACRARLDNLLLGRLRTALPADIEQLPDVSEGLQFKILAAALEAGNQQELLAAMKSKRYPATRLQRILIHALLGMTKSTIAQFDQTGPLYARVLAFNDNGRQLLKKISRNASFPVITKTTRHLNSTSRHRPALSMLQQLLALDTLATDIFSLSLPSAPWTAGGWDFRQPPFYLADAGSASTSVYNGKGK
ncbi:nucleotidyltransferase|uniref:tRNA(Met) cytidine acetate ligase n=1 Tax=Dendrosporobacter quercicolus TaxID=146817 RepID=A0A1G9L7B4_9FIRM|nr:nucleotidyltransferase [Dendrosporobacter quercicolus]NSL46626.1 nucleotidyltransferase [Dendrosporobacter quercicolus DSM 1736]SDL57879.1 Predicted nucleotidyltransferase [Dendrosporobacter quercicolus]